MDQPCKPGVDVPLPGHNRGLENKVLTLSHLVLDFNGTIARDGVLLPGVAERLTALAELLDVRVLTADTFGTARAALAELPVRVDLLADIPEPAGFELGEDRRKLRALRAIVGCGDAAPLPSIAYMGNGANDRLALIHVPLSIVVIGPEGAWAPGIEAADIVVASPLDGLDLLLNPARITATLRR